MSQPWLEDLSEEWIPQSTPSVDSHDRVNPLATHNSQSVPPKPRSRLPRMRHSSGSYSDIQVRQTGQGLRLPKTRSALAERSLSDNNIHSSDSHDLSLNEPSHDPLSFSADSAGSVVYKGTVAQKPSVPSPTKEKPAHDTPEWRKRLLNGDIGYGDQKDLFSPMGLENIFQKPAGGTPEDTQTPKRKLGMLKGIAMPSSPPPWPSKEHNNEEPARHGEDEIDAQEDTDRTQQARGTSDQNQGQRDSGLEMRATESTSNSTIEAANQGPRTVSGQLEYDNENFSPVYLSTNLKIGNAPNATPNFRGSELANRLRHIGSPPPSQGAREGNSGTQSQGNSSYVRLQDDSLPEGLPAGTPEVVDAGGFVQMRRGGYSREGSFRRRPLSPSPPKVTSRSILESNVTSEKDTTREYAASECPAQTSGSLSPKTPQKQDQSKFLSPERAKSSGSPLKLFDAHDTFTSNRLQRRLSQLDYRLDKTASSSVRTEKAETTKIAQKTSRLTSVEEASFQNSAMSDAHERRTTPRRVGTFGEGYFNEFKFAGDYSIDSSRHSEEQDSAPDESPSADVAPPGSRQPFKFQLDDPISSEPSRAKRQGLTRISNPFRNPSQTRHGLVRRTSSMTSRPDPKPEVEYAEGKRGPTSPFKNPTPKRRRTIHSTSDEDDIFSDSGMKTVQDSHVLMQSVIGKKRKDAREDHSNNVADPEVLARRHILRPRNPTPSQRRVDDVHAEIMEATEAFIHSSPKLNTIREHLDASFGSNGPSQEVRAAVANEVASFNMKRHQVVRDESRKRSVTTQDFLDEAVKIMDFIRAKGRPNSGLGSLEESEAEFCTEQDNDPLPSISLTFERPPSREGCVSGWREPNKHQLDPSIANHLRQYQEKESSEFMGSSIRSLRFSPIKDLPPEVEGENVVVQQDDIRITDNLNRRDEFRTADEDVLDSRPRTGFTQQSTGSSMGHTALTSSSKRSDHVANLAPEAIAHLIPKEVAGMSFDREKNIWVRQKSPSKEHREEEKEHSRTNESEEDPFGNIPDLSVDESKEKLANRGSPTRPQPTAETILEDTEEENKVRPVTREGQGIAFTDTSSVPSKVSNNFAWSFPKTDTRATSWSDQESRNPGTQKMQQPPPTTYAIPESDEDDVEHEIRFFEGRGTTNSTVRNGRVRDITISIAEHDYQGPDDQGQYLINQRKPVENQRSSPDKCSSSPAKRMNWGQMKGAKTMPHGRKGRVPFFQREGELSLLEDEPSNNYRMQLSMSVSAPALRQTQHEPLAPVESSPAKGDATFMLSDLPEFTLNQVDECEIPDRVVVKHDGVRFSKDLEDRYAQGTAELVKALQDVEPDEPYWEDLRKVDLHDKNLTNLFRLDEFCYRLEELDVSDNRIAQVKGIPFTVRRLRAANNCLTGLTPWTTLMNLQHLDLSGNDIDSLDGLTDLVHLRSLKVDDNKLKSIHGILDLDGLMELSVARNEIDEIDFAQTNLKSLTELDLRGNRLLEIRNVHCLPRLEHLDLDDNCIEEFPGAGALNGRCNNLRSLRLCRNTICSLDVNGYFPKLESLYADGNSLAQIPGLENLRYLRTLSAREQMLESGSEADTCVANLVRNSDVRNLYISLNPTCGLQIPQHLLNLQRLELASMGLKELPSDFGQLTPNIRSLNLNFNSLRDIRPLLNIKRLSELLLVGNKLERLRASAMVLGKLTTLTKLDWRDNPLTLRFYPPASENRIMSLRRRPSEEQTTDRFVLPDGDVDADQQYLARLDYETRIRRRVTEMMLANLCSNLRELDGQKFDKARVLVKDDVWERLLFLGVIQRKQTEITEDVEG